MSHEAPESLAPSSVPTSESEEPKTSRRMWRSLAEYHGGERFELRLQRQHPQQTHKVFDPPERRDFLKLLGASLALAGVSASCTKQPEEKLVPWARNPEQLLPGKPLFFATSMPWAGGSIGLLVESHMGRPTKCEGNADHPASLGATDVWSQAAVLGLYDPDRSQSILYRGRAATWSSFLDTLKQVLTEQAGKQGAGLRVLTQAVVSPTLAAQLQELLAKYPKAAWHQWQPHNRDNARAGALLAFGKDVVALPRFDKADVVVSLEADFLASAPGNVRAIRDFAGRRKLRGGKTERLNRLYVLEGRPSCTGAVADQRLTLRPGEIEGAARALGARLGVEGGSAAPADAACARWVEAAAKDLAAHKGSALVVAGESQPPAVHALAHLINEQLESNGSCVQYLPPAELSGSDNAQSLRALVAEMKNGQVEILVMLAGNPVYDAPADLDFAGALAKVPLRAHLSLYQDETSELVDWHLNEAHFLESWSDARSADGTLGIVQPLIAPLYGGKSAHEILAVLLDKPGVAAYDTLRENTKKLIGEADFERKWRRAVHDGLIAGSAAAPVPVTGQKLAQAPAPAPVGLEIVFRHDPLVHDGRFSNNGWLLEQPRPMTMLTWDNVVQLSVATAAKNGIETGDVLEISFDGRKLRGPAFVTPGHADESLTLTLGFGRRKAGRMGSGVGYDAYALRSSNALDQGSGATLRNTGETYELATTQEHDDMTTNLPEDRREELSPVRVATVDHFRKNPRLVEPHKEPENTSLYPERPQGEYAWGMVIDLNACTACGACVTACSAENNIAVVGKAEILRGREMHWLRIDRYFQGDPRNPRIYTQPIPCMQCENAPCESVCPVAATSHSPEGLNDMVYNRCIGTRYCANNCPYKVRRFNFFLYSDYDSESLKLARNPDVTVRSRGVMEKCTYCVQRINRARLAARKEERKIRDGEIRTACQAVCPAEAIVFGDIRDPHSAVAQQKAEPHNYALLEELNTRPRTTYLARITNPNRELES
jgi:molybdopterin-containing oxidoreductase family iron-sulfur binding subunit